MNKKEAAKEVLRQEGETLDGWLAKANRVRELVPHVQRARDHVTWQEQALSEMPPESEMRFGEEFFKRHEIAHEFININLPDISQHITNPSSLSAVSSNF